MPVQRGCAGIPAPGTGDPCDNKRLPHGDIHRARSTLYYLAPVRDPCPREDTQITARKYSLPNWLHSNRRSCRRLCPRLFASAPVAFPRLPERLVTLENGGFLAALLYPLVQCGSWEIFDDHSALEFIGSQRITWALQLLRYYTEPLRYRTQVLTIPTLKGKSR